LASETRMREIVVLAPNQNNREPVAVVLRDKSEQHVTSANDRVTPKLRGQLSRRLLRDLPVPSECDD